MSEDTPNEVIHPTPHHVEEHAHKPRGRRILVWATLVAMLFAAGFFAAYFLLYVPIQTREAGLLLKAQELESTKTQLASTEQLLADTQAKLETAEGDTVRLKRISDLLKVQHALVTARLALMEQDTLTASQAVELAQTDLNSLLTGLDEPDTVKALQERMAAARTALKGKVINQAMEELRSLDENLSFLYQRISK